MQGRILNVVQWNVSYPNMSGLNPVRNYDTEVWLHVSSPSLAFNL